MRTSILLLIIIIVAGCGDDLKPTGERIGSSWDGIRKVVIEVEGHRYLVVTHHNGIAVCPLIIDDGEIIPPPAKEK